MTDAPAELAARARARTSADRAAVVAVAGAVSVGKSTLAAALGDALTASGAVAEVVSTDGFLFPNAELSARGLSMRKGFPESYDVDALRGFLDAVRAGAPDVGAPVYSHETYDIVPGERHVVAHANVIVVEGVNALYATVGLVDLGVYVHADDDVIESWYTERFHRLCATATPGTFYANFAGYDETTISEMADEVWRSINLPNLRDYIGPSRKFADVIVEKRPDHEVAAIVDVERR